jgi:hypothetical protein
MIMVRDGTFGQLNGSLKGNPGILMGIINLENEFELLEQALNKQIQTGVGE